MATHLPSGDRSFFQEDDEYYESTENFNGFWNSEHSSSDYFEIFKLTF